MRDTIADGTAPNAAPLPSGQRAGSDSRRLEMLIAEIGTRLRSLCPRMPTPEFSALVRCAAATAEQWEQRSARLGAVDAREATNTALRETAGQLRTAARDAVADARRTCMTARITRDHSFESRVGRSNRA